MKRLLLAMSLSISSLALAQGSGAPPPVPAEAPKAPGKFLANGNDAVDIPEGGFTIVPPAGWEVIRNGSGASLLFQAPKGPQPVGVVTYQPNMRVMMFGEPRPMDDDTKNEYSKVIVEKYATVSSAVSNYMIRSADKVKLQNGTDAFLYYAEFSFSGTPTMQMHILVSSGSKHFLMTYTDLASVFEKQEPGLTTAYTSMQSVKLDSLPPDRWLQYQIAGGGFVALFFVLILIRVIRGQRMKRLGERIENEDGGISTDDDNDHDAYEATSSISAISEVADHDDDYDMPETREAPASRKAERPEAPAPFAKKAIPVSAPPRVPAPAPAPAAKKSSPPVVPQASAPAAPAPAPVQPPAAKFEVRTRKSTLSSEVAPVEVPDEASSAVSSIRGTWNLDESASRHQADSDFENSHLSEIKTKPKSVIAPATKSKHQKAPAPRMQESDDDGDVSKVARLSEILPNTGDTKKKKKGLFGWGKGKGKGKGKDYDDEKQDACANDNHDIDGDEDWDKASQSKSIDKSYRDEVPAKGKTQSKPQAKSMSSSKSQPASQVSEIADGGWNLSEGHADHAADDDDD